MTDINQAHVTDGMVVEASFARHFRDLGRGVQESHRFAAHLLSALQYAPPLAYTFDDPEFVTGEAALLKNRIQAL